ncbi:hypothetical protein BGZ60DRAFT_551169 [Tricladium varicosporioides]|nr:hypothetical protein BGZ60DRAFT_551169 [Hymenoscyphus varicosporioides]
MSSPPSEFSTPPPKINQDTFLGFVWGGLVVATFFVIFRAWARYRTFGRYFMDDAFVLLALILFLASAIIWQCTSKYMYQALYLASGLSSDISTNFVKETETYLRAQIGIIFLFTSGLWSIKIAFLLFFRRLGENVSGQMLHWWSVFVFTIVTYIVGIGTIQYNCLAPSFIQIVTKCSGPEAKYFEHATLATNLAMDVSTDLLILSIPIRMLWKVRIHLRQKLALAAIFCLVMITIAIAIVRFAVVSQYSQPEQSWLYFWNTIETIIIACLASFRALFRKQEKHIKVQDSTDNSRKRLFGDLRDLPIWSGSWRPRGRSTIAKPSLIMKQPADYKTSQEQMIPPGRVYVRTDVELSNWTRQDV